MCQNTKKGVIMTQQKEFYPLLAQLINFIAQWEKDSKTQLQFELNRPIKLSEIENILQSSRVASGPGLCYNLSILEKFLFIQEIIDDREKVHLISFNHPSKMKIYMYCLEKTKKEQPA